MILCVGKGMNISDLRVMNPKLRKKRARPNLSDHLFSQKCFVVVLKISYIRRINFIQHHSTKKVNEIKMTLTQIYDRIEDLLEEIKRNPEDQDCLFKCETEINSLEQLREEMEGNC